jgi:hypothetical protein
MLVDFSTDHSCRSTHKVVQNFTPLQAILETVSHGKAIMCILLEQQNTRHTETQLGSSQALYDRHLGLEADSEVLMLYSLGCS